MVEKRIGVVQGESLPEHVTGTIGKGIGHEVDHSDSLL